MDLSTLPDDLQTLLSTPRPTRTLLNLAYGFGLHDAHCGRLNATDAGEVGENTVLEIISHTSCAWCFDGTELERYSTPLTWLIWSHHGISPTSDRIPYGNFFGFLEDNVMRMEELCAELLPLVPTALEGIERQRRHHHDWLEHRSLQALELLSSAAVLLGTPSAWGYATVNMVNALMLERDLNPTTTVTPSDSGPFPVAQTAQELRDFHRTRARAAGYLALRTDSDMLYDVFLSTPGEEAITRWMPSETTLLVPATLAPLVDDIANYHDPSSTTRVAFDGDPGVVDAMRTLMADGTDLDLALDLAKRL